MKHIGFPARDDRADGNVENAGSGPGALTHWLDRGAIGLSVLCLVHCLALPLLVMALPALGEVLPRQWWVHPLIFAVAVPLATVALIRGLLGHGDRRPIVLGGAGLALLGLGLLAAEGSATEVVLTVAGGSILATAHLVNWRLGSHGIGRSTPRRTL